MDGARQASISTAVAECCMAIEVAADSSARLEGSINVVTGCALLPEKDKTRIGLKTSTDEIGRGLGVCDLFLRERIRGSAIRDMWQRRESDPAKGP